MPTESTQSSSQAITVQDGHLTFGAWTESNNVYQSLSGASSIGIIFDFTSIMTPSLIMEPDRLIFRMFPSDTATDLVNAVYVIDEDSPEDYSDSLPPGSRTNEIKICEVTGDYRTGDLTWPDGSGVDFTYYLGMRNTGGTWAEDTTFMAAWRTYIGKRLRRADWSGRIAFSIVSETELVPYYYSTVEATSGLHPSMGWTQWRAHGGHNIGGTGRKRATYCSRSGLPLMSESLVEDGYQTGLYVHPDWYEPEDEDYNRRDLPSTERDTDDRWGSDG